jgi:DNA excision repair protein ERCC-2
VLRFDDEQRTLELGVGDLLEIGPRRGDLELNAAIATRARMAAGVEAHQSWQAARVLEDERFRREVTIRHRVVVKGWDVTISGRIDGLTEEADVWVVEELKSTALDADRLAVLSVDDFPLYREQLVLYLHFLEARGQPAIGRLVLLSLADASKRVFHVESDPTRGARMLADLEYAIEQREDWLRWMAIRRDAPVVFSHPAFREGQQDLVSTVEEALHQGQHLLLTAPTGLGKTAAVLHAALRVAYATDRKVFFATARTTQQKLALDTLEVIARAGTPIRAVGLRAREKVCLNDVVICRAEACRFADGFFDRMASNSVLAQLWGLGVLTPERVIAVGEREMVCPYAAAAEASEHADVVVGDYNYVFDPAVRLRKFFHEEPEQWIVVVDEAHNLGERARGYGSPVLEAKTVVGALVCADVRYGPFRDLAAELRDWLGGLASFYEEREVAIPLDDLDLRGLRVLAERADTLALDYSLAAASFPFFPRDGDPWIAMVRELIRFRAVVDRAGAETVALVSPDRLQLLCRDPSPIVGPVFEGLAASVLMSATLTPPEFHKEELGLGSRAASAAFPSPFPPENRKVLVVPDVTTEFRHRRRDRDATARHVSEVLRAVPGNVAVFFPSFQLLDEIESLVDVGGRPVLRQGRSMDESERADLLAVLARGEGHVLFGVLGGIFAEGVDLPGRGLLSAVIVGPALPPIGLERTLLRVWYEERYGAGAFYAFVQPGMTRVVQAAGRVVRTPEDKGVLVLLDRRFLLKDYARLFPEDWEPIRTRDPASEIEGFFDPS